MKIKEKIKSIFKNKTDIPINTLNFNDFFGVNSEDSSNVVYFTCLKVLSESIGKLSIHLKDKDNQRVLNHETVDFLKYKPNELMNATIFKSLIEYQRNHYGNSYIYLKYDKGKLKGLYPLDPRCVRVLIDNANIFGGGIKYEYNINGKSFIFDEKEIIHLKSGAGTNGIVGQSVREKLASTLEGVASSQKYLNKLYKRGMTAKGVLRYTGDLNEDKRKELLKKINSILENDDINGLGLLPLPPGMDIVPLDLKLTDSQFFELKKYTALQIASAFGVKPNQLNDYEKSSYANSEMQNLTFYIDTLLYILTQYEEEFTYKLLTEQERKDGLHFEFNVASLLRGDLKTQAECIAKYIQSGVYTINEARSFAGLTPRTDGDVIVINGSYVPLEKVGLAYEKKGGGKNE